MWGLFLWFLLPIAMVLGSPCCPNNSQMFHVNQSVLCEDQTPISVYDWCVNFFVVDPQLETFSENEQKNQYKLDGDWSETYCTGRFLNNSGQPSLIGKDLVMVCFPAGEPEDHFSLYATCLLISCVFLLATLIIYLLLPELRDLQGKCVICNIFSLMIAYLCLAYLQLPISRYIGDTQCVVIAFFTYFWMMSAFFWLNINSFNMWRSAVLAHINMAERKLMSAYYLAGWGFPLIFFSAALITHNLPGDLIRPNFGIHSCWFQEKLELWTYFYGPVSVLLILNIIYFISTALYLWSDYRDPNPMPRIKSLRIKFGLYLKMFLAMGITWVFEILSSIHGEPWYVTDILNCLQGVIIFIVMVVLRKRVLRSLAARKLCGIQFVNCWEKMEDEETINEFVEEQQLSSQQTKALDI